MNVRRTSEPSTFSLPPAFTLGSALRWLGHDCLHDRCYSVPVNSLNASMWFLRWGRQARTFPLETRIVVDSVGIGDIRVHRMIHQVDSCTRRDGIEVRHRPIGLAHRSP